VRKILSILIALGLVLAFSVVAMPTTGAACGATVALSSYCASATGVTYTINFTSPVTLLPGNDALSVHFADGTSLASVLKTNVTVTDVTTTGSGSPTAITVSGTDISFAVPAGVGMISAGNAVGIVIANVGNPVTPGATSLTLDYKLTCCPAVVFDCATYTIKPATSSYGLTVDFGATYPGIAEGFVPPFKACGQNSTADVHTVYIAPYWYDQFDLNLVETVTGCAAACANATLSFNVTSFPTPSTGAVVSLNISGQNFTLTPAASSGTLTAPIGLIVGSNISLYSLLHFNKVGAYTICFDVTCPGSPAGTCPACLPATGPASIIGGPACFDFYAYQQKEAFKMTLDEKWNLISLPLVPLGADGSISIEDALASLPAAVTANLVSIWYYDCAAADWLMYPGGGLTTLEDGKAYWLRMTYPLPSCGNFTWWVWGTAKPEPPAAPSQYPVCEGWNMVGYTELTAGAPNLYLWNWTSAPTPVVYGWTPGCWTSQGWSLQTFAGGSMVPGQGYWVAFPAAGAVYVP
jgi:hypothetical protein